jgi:hypothetical protein
MGEVGAVMSGVAATVMAVAVVAWQTAPGPGLEARAERTKLRVAVGSVRVLGPEQLVVGRTFDGTEAELLLESRRLLRVNLRTGRSTSIDLVGLRSTDRPWGMARLQDGARWTLLDRWTLALMGSDGRLTSRHPLARPHIGLYGLGDRLLYQAFESDPRQPGVTVGPPGNLYRHPVQLGARAEAGNRGAASRLETLLACGTSVWPSLPCWLSAPGPLHIVYDSGATGDVRLDWSALQRWVGEQAVGGHDTVRDASIGPARQVWVLLEHAASAREPEALPAGARTLGLMAPDGRVLGAVVLEVSARLILGSTDAACHLLTVDGLVVSVSRT